MIYSTRYSLILIDILLSVSFTTGLLFGLNGSNEHLQRPEEVHYLPVVEERRTIIENTAEYIEINFTVSDEIFANPERGFYHYIETRASNQNDYNLATLQGYRNNEDITLLYCINYLDTFVDSPISQSYLDHLQSNLDTVREAGLKCILRFAYTDVLPVDEQPPFGDADKEQIMTHLDQLEPILQSNSDVIAVMQAGFIGVWGEWYYTDHFVDDPTTPWIISEEQHQHRLDILERILEILPESHQVQVRYPHGKQAMFGTSDPISVTQAYDGSDITRVGFHNDCFLASDTDFGTYRSDSIEDDKAYVSAETNYLPMGGETCFPNPPRSECPTAVAELADMHWSYLNRDYHPDVYSGWESGGCIPEMQRQLGYRFSLISGSFPISVKEEQPFEIELVIENNGYTAPFKPYNASLVFDHVDSDTSHTVAIVDVDPRLWLPGEPHTISVNTVLFGLPLGDYDISLKVADPTVADEFGSIRFANEFVWDEVNYQNNLLHTISLVEEVLPPAPITDLNISKTDTEIQLDWTTVSENIDGATIVIDHYNIYRSSEPYFVPDESTLYDSSTTNSYTDANGLSDSGDWYYLVTAVSQELASSSSNEVGKFTIELSPQWNLLSLPLIPIDGSLDAILGTQLFGTEDPQTADRILIWNTDTQSYDSAWFCGGPVCETFGEPFYNHWLANDFSQSPLTIEPDSGFWLQNRSGEAETLIIVGQVANANREVSIEPGYQLLGSAFPTSKPLDEANLPATGTEDPQTGDRILYWDALNQTYESAWFCGGPICETFGEPFYNHWLANDYSATTIVLEPGHGFWYQNRHDALIWANVAP